MFIGDKVVYLFLFKYFIVIIKKVEMLYMYVVLNIIVGHICYKASNMAILLLFLYSPIMVTVL